MTGYLAVGHGKKPDGRYDPGAIGSKGEHEHILADKVAAVASAILTSGGEPHDTEVDGGVGHDPNFLGSVKRVNAGKYAWAVEVHFDWRGAQPGGFGLYVSEKARQLAVLIGDRYQAAKLPLRKHTRRTNLYFLARTNCPALIWECGPVGAYTEAQLTDMGRAIGYGILAWLGKGAPEYVPIVHTPPPPPAPPATVTDETQRIKELQRHLGVDDDGLWGPKTAGACERNLVGWGEEVKRRTGRNVHLAGNNNKGLVSWLQSQGNRLGYACAVDGLPGPQTNHLIVVVLGQKDGICGPNGFRAACR